MLWHQSLYSSCSRQCLWTKICFIEPSRARRRLKLKISSIINWADWEEILNTSSISPLLFSLFEEVEIHEIWLKREITYHNRCSQECNHFRIKMYRTDYPFIWFQQRSIHSTITDVISCPACRSSTISSRIRSHLQIAFKIRDEQSFP